MPPTFLTILLANARNPSGKNICPPQPSIDSEINAEICSSLFFNKSRILCTCFI